MIPREPGKVRLIEAVRGNVTAIREIDDPTTPKDVLAAVLVTEQP
jgi:hypothetical protein